MVKKYFSKRRLRTGAVFTGVGMIFILLYLIFFRDEGIAKGVEQTRKLALKNQNVINLKEITKSMNDPLRKDPSKDFKIKNEKDNENEIHLEDIYQNKNIDGGKETEEEEEEGVEEGEYEKLINENNENTNDNNIENDNENKDVNNNSNENENEKPKDQNSKEKSNKKNKGKNKYKHGKKKPSNNSKSKMMKNKSEDGKKIGSNTPMSEMKVDSFSTKDFFKLYHSGSNYRDGDDPQGLECPVPWTWTDNESESDIIVMNVLDNLGDIIRIENYDYDKDRQKLLLMSMESTSNYPYMIAKKKAFDYFIDYRLDSDVPIPYTYGFFDFSKLPVPTKQKGLGGRGLAAVFISNCSARNKRLEYLKELMKYTKIDSFGMCAHNSEVFEEDEDANSWKTKMNTIRKYKFTIAFENSNDRDYVTEKFFQPLEAGSVPVFYGTSNIADFAPPHSYIDANDFESPKELAEYLEFLDKNDREYEEYLAWKKTGFGENLSHLIEIRKLNSICQLLQRIKGLWINPYLTIWDRDDIPKNERACGLC